MGSVAAASAQTDRCAAVSLLWSRCGRGCWPCTQASAGGWSFQNVQQGEPLGQTGRPAAAAECERCSAGVTARCQAAVTCWLRSGTGRPRGRPWVRGLRPPALDSEPPPPRHCRPPCCMRASSRLLPAASPGVTRGPCLPGEARGRHATQRACERGARLLATGSLRPVCRAPRSTPPLLSPRGRGARLAWRRAPA